MSARLKKTKNIGGARVEKVLTNPFAMVLTKGPALRPSNTSPKEIARFISAGVKEPPTPPSAMVHMKVERTPLKFESYITKKSKPLAQRLPTVGARQKPSATGILKVKPAC